MTNIPSTTIFVVDDDEGIRSLAMTVLKKAGYNVTAYETIPAALEKLQDGTNPSLIVLDGLFPGMDAYDFFDAIAANASYPAVSVLMISDMLDLSRVKDRPKVKIAGRLDKPFSPDTLMKAILGALSDL